MCFPLLELTPKECHALLQAIVDCDPALHAKILEYANEYTIDPEFYERKIQILEQFHKEICSPGHDSFVSIQHLEHKYYKVSWTDNMGGQDSCVFDYEAKHFIGY